MTFFTFLLLQTTMKKDCSNKRERNTRVMTPLYTYCVFANVVITGYSYIRKSQNCARLYALGKRTDVKNSRLKCYH